MLPAGTLDQARALLAALEARGQTLATAESCTGGLIAAALTAIAGSSSVVMAGYVTYSNAAKVRMVGVAESSLAAHGAVSEAVARAMAEGALAHSRADIAVAVTGVAGPTGGSAEKPVGTVWLAWALRRGIVHTELLHLPGDRAAVRAATVAHALAGVRLRATPL